MVSRRDLSPFRRLSAETGRTGAAHGAFALAHLPRQGQGLVVPQSGAAVLGVGLGEAEARESLLQPTTFLRIVRKQNTRVSGRGLLPGEGGKDGDRLSGDDISARPLTSYLLQTAGLEVLELLLKTDVRIRDGAAHPDDLERLLPREISGTHDVGHRHRHAPRHSRQTEKDQISFREGSRARARAPSFP